MWPAGPGAEIDAWVLRERGRRSSRATSFVVIRQHELLLLRGIPSTASIPRSHAPP